MKFAYRLAVVAVALATPPPALAATLDAVLYKNVDQLYGGGNIGAVPVIVLNFIYALKSEVRSSAFS